MSTPPLLRLGEALRVTAEELDFFINYDIKCRMGGVDEEQED